MWVIFLHDPVYLKPDFMGVVVVSDFIFLNIILPSIYTIFGFERGGPTVKRNLNNHTRNKPNTYHILFYLQAISMISTWEVEMFFGTTQYYSAKIFPSSLSTSVFYISLFFAIAFFCWVEVIILLLHNC